MFDLTISIVVYHSDLVALTRGIASLDVAVANLKLHRADFGHALLTLIDNGDDRLATIFDENNWPVNLDIQVREGHGNVGYGAGHNLTIESVKSLYHLILNPDVDLAPDALHKGLTFLDQHPDCVAVTPRICGGDGQLQFLCRRFPSVADLFIRGFLPMTWRRFFARRLALYEMRAEVNEQELICSLTDREGTFFSPEIMSGCFMLFRTERLQYLGGFDPRYFLYFEDYDLSLRAGRLGYIAYVPGMNIIHYGGGASRKGISHVRMFTKSAISFFCRFGWRWR